MCKTRVVESTGLGTVSGKREVKVENTGYGFFFRQNMNFPHYNPQHLGLKCVKCFVRKKTIQEPTCGALLLILFGRLFYSLAQTFCVGKKNILKPTCRALQVGIGLLLVKIYECEKVQKIFFQFL